MKNFLKSAAHQHKDPQVRLTAIADLNGDSPEAQDMLMELARNDVDEAVRIAAIGKLDELNVLRELLGTEAKEPDSISQAAESRLIQKLHEDSVSDVSVRVLLSTHAARLAIPVASQAPVAAHREEALAAISDEPALLSVVQQTRFHDTRLAAALRLSQHDTLRSALTAVRSKDKVVAKQIQQRLDAEAAAEAALISRKHAVSTTLKSVQSLVEGVWTPQHGGRLQAAKERWATFEQEDIEELDSDFNQAVKAAQVALDEYTAAQTSAVEGADTSSSKTDANAAPNAEESVGETPAPVAKVEDPALEPILSALKPSTIEALPTILESLQSKVAGDSNLSSSEHVKTVLAYGSSIAVLFDPPYELNKARPAALQSRIKRVSALLDVDSLLAGIDVADHAYVQELAEHLKSMNDRVGKARQESADRVKATHRQFAALSGIVKEGKWGPANSMMRRLQKKVAAMEPGERSGLDEKLARAETQLAEMADWQDFAARPKLEALCESMEGLPAKELSPDALAKQVRELQNAWKALGVSRASNELWTRFKTAGDVAYEPCKVWFDKKQQERQVKLDAKAKLCESLEQQHNALEGNPDWKAIVRQVNNAKREWSANRIPDRKPDKGLEKRFSAALKPFEDALGIQYTANAEAKQALVEKVAALAEGDITQHSANQAKSLLSAWKLVGIMRRKEDQALWEVFNGHLGTIFKHQHQVEREKQRAGLEHVFRAKDIIKRLKQLSKGDSLDDSVVQELSTEFQGLAEFPDRDKKFLLRDFREAMNACSRVQEKASRRRLEAENEERQRLVGLCEQLELATEKPDEVVENLVEDVKHAWDASDARVTADTAALLKKRRDAAIKHIQAGTQPDFAGNESLRRDLLIRMEVAAGIDTPAEDKARRMQYQLQHLQEGMTSAGVNDAKHTLKKLEQEWLSVGPASQSVGGALQSRFLRAYKR